MDDDDGPAHEQPAQDTCGEVVSCVASWRGWWARRRTDIDRRGSKNLLKKTAAVVWIGTTGHTRSAKKQVWVGEVE